MLTALIVAVLELHRFADGHGEDRIAQPLAQVVGCDERVLDDDVRALALLRRHAHVAVGVFELDQRGLDRPLLGVLHLEAP